MAIAGSARPGTWMQVVDGKLIVGRTEATVVTEHDEPTIYERLSRGERVCVDIYAGMAGRVALTMRTALGEDLSGGR